MQIKLQKNGAVITTISSFDLERVFCHQSFHLPNITEEVRKAFHFMALNREGLLLVTLACLVVCVTATRDLLMKPKHDLSARLQTNGDVVDCWSSLLELKSCSNEIVLFFMNGEAHIGPECCHAIYVITRNCWPAMLTSLGFTVEEANILRGYCDAAAASTPALAPLGPAKCYYH